jgi:hypothetical protein
VIADNSNVFPLHNMMAFSLNVPTL